MPTRESETGDVTLKWRSAGCRCLSLSRCLTLLLVAGRRELKRMSGTSCVTECVCVLKRGGGGMGGRSLFENLNQPIRCWDEAGRNSGSRRRDFAVIHGFEDKLSAGSSVTVKTSTERGATTRRSQPGCLCSVSAPVATDSGYSTECVCSCAKTYAQQFISQPLHCCLSWQLYIYSLAF